MHRTDDLGVISQVRAEAASPASHPLPPAALSSRTDEGRVCFPTDYAPVLRPFHVYLRPPQPAVGGAHSGITVITLGEKTKQAQVRGLETPNSSGRARLPLPLEERKQA